ncbi:hypothetical protein MBLNU230_g6388t1 [Neophaeotheca triangularis]
MSHVLRNRSEQPALSAEPSSAALGDTAQSVLPKREKQLPTTCPGCGALGQVVDPEVAGFYNPDRKAVKSYLRGSDTKAEEDSIFKEALARLDKSTFPSMDRELEEQPRSRPRTDDAPICDRCHELRHQSKGTGIIHPSMQSIQAIIEESPHKHNHIYHVVDAADFPMSLIPNLQHALNLPRLRTQNRRSKHMRYVRGRVAEVSFIITRSDLLAPTKEQVDRLMPYLQAVLRDALARNDKKMRLGNVRCVSARRGWWTKHVKEEIWARGGAGWMVGKVNVGKSALFEVVFPKGRNENVKRLRAEAESSAADSAVDMPKLIEGSDPGVGESVEAIDAPTESIEEPKAQSAETSREGDTAKVRKDESFQESELLMSKAQAADHEEDFGLDEDIDSSLLPPAQRETAYPSMPLVSSLPGTTASPIRIPFGGGKGELIDLPGVHRSSLDEHVKDEHKSELVMSSRIVPEQQTIKSGQSLLVGGMIRITPEAEDHVFLAYNFTPLHTHVTGTEKAIAIQTGQHTDGTPYAGTVPSIATDMAKSIMKSAGNFYVEWDATKPRAGPLTDPSAGKQKAASLPFTVYSADILIEGVGWVEIACQVRNKMGLQLPKIEVFSPQGHYVGIRRPMNAYLLGGPKTTGNHERRPRPRQSISLQKRKRQG